MSIYSRIADKWHEFSYPNLKCDEFSLPFYTEYHSKVESAYNKLPLKAKKILNGATLYLCCSETINKVADCENILGLCRPGEKGIWYNIEKFTADNHGFDEKRFDTLLFHEIGHYLVHHFTDHEQQYYVKRFGTHPVTSGEPEADGFASYMMGVAPYQNQEFWAWWLLNNT